MIPGRKFQRLLEIGYGSGVFMPELAEHTDELWGVDIHSRTEAVSKRLQDLGAAIYRGCKLHALSRLAFRLHRGNQHYRIHRRSGCSLQ